MGMTSMSNSRNLNLTDNQTKDNMDLISMSDSKCLDITMFYSYMSDSERFSIIKILKTW